MTTAAKHKNGTVAGPGTTARERVAERILRLEATDEQFRNAKPDLSLQAAARQPGLRLPQILEMFAEGYADRPALGWRARELMTDAATGRTTTRLLPQFETISYREVWARVSAIATRVAARRRRHPVNPGDFVATVGFASAEYLIVDLVCGYLGLVTVPLQHNAPASRLTADHRRNRAAGGRGRRRISRSCCRIGAEQRVVAASGGLRLPTRGRRPSRETAGGARASCADAGMSVTIETLDEVRRARSRVAAGARVHRRQRRPAGDDHVHVGEHRGAQRARCTPSGCSPSCGRREHYPESPTPVFNVNFMPLNHVGGRIPLVFSFHAGRNQLFRPGERTCRRCSKTGHLVRPTEIGLVPRVVDMLFQRYRSCSGAARGAGR